MQKPKITKRRVIFTVIAIVTAFFVFSYISNKNKPLEVKTTKAEVRDIIKTLAVSGTVEAKNQANLSFTTSGKVQSIKVALGEQIAKNQILANLDTNYLYNSYLSQKALADKSRESLKTFIETYKDDPDTAAVGSDDIYWQKYKEYQDTIASYAASSDASLSSLSNAYIKSPLDGTVTKTSFKEGEFATAGVTAFEVTDLNSLYFEILISQEDIGQVASGMTVNIEFDTYPQKFYQGQIYEIETTPTKDTSGNNSYKVKISFGDSSLPRLKLGMEGTADIILENKLSALSIDASAVLAKNDIDFVYKIENGKAKKIDVKTDFEGDTYIEIKEGLQTGDETVLSPLDKVTEGKKVRAL